MSKLPSLPTAVALAAAVFVSTPGMPAAEEIALDDLSTLPSADVVIFGEVHDNPLHHLTQAVLISAKAPKAVVLEMISDAAARRVRPEMFEDATVLSETLGWADSGWPEFEMYYPIFFAAEGAVLYGADAPRDLVFKAAQDGVAAVFGNSADVFGLDEPLDADEQGAREAVMQEAHCNAMPADILPGMVAAQRLRNGYLARATLAAYLETGGPVVLITGNGHARRDWGVPRLLGAAMPELSVISIGQLEAPPGAPPSFDYWLVSEPAERPDPCTIFEQR